MAATAEHGGHCRTDDPDLALFASFHDLFDFPDHIQPLPPLPTISSSSGAGNIHDDPFPIAPIPHRRTHAGDGPSESPPTKQKGDKGRQPQPRYAFKTRSQVDHLEDGYRWHKYGQKAVKSSPFPRIYYRCTSAACGVKKRVEHAQDDPGVVVTTYEGKHTHPCPTAAMGSILTPPVKVAAPARQA